MNVDCDVFDLKAIISVINDAPDGAHEINRDEAVILGVPIPQLPIESDLRRKTECLMAMADHLR